MAGNSKGSRNRDDLMKADSTWHWDKRIPIALIATLAIQTGGFIWAAAGAYERINTLEKQSAISSPQLLEQGNRLTRVETRLEAVQAGIGEIKTLLQPKARN